MAEMKIIAVFLESGMLADHGGKLETVQFRHADVDQNDRNFVLEQVFERFAARAATTRFSPSSLRMTS